MDDYYAERVDVHKAANVWPLLGNLLPEDQIEPNVFADSHSAKTEPIEPPHEDAPVKRRCRAHKSEL